jgi:uncharacterized membrane protein YphA (DoxX/SURF4 family)
MSQTGERPVWQTAVSTLAGIALAALFLSSGLWKLIDPMAWSERLVQALFPRQLALAGALVVGTLEVLAGVLLVAPRWRRWGAWLCGLLLVVFMAYFAVNYNALRGSDCSCFPWVKRVVGPGFFIGDAAMMLLAVLAGLWARQSQGWKQAGIALGVIVVFAGALLGYQAFRGGGVVAPATISADGKPFPLRTGRVFVFFFDPECAHCYAAAKDFATYRWKTEVQLVATPTTQPQWGAGFLKRTGFNARLSLDAKVLRESFRFTDPPYAVALEDGRLKQALLYFDDVEPRKSLKALGWIE